MADTLPKIKSGRHVIIIDNSKQKRVYQVEQDKNIEHYKCTISCNELIGQKFNSFFLVTDANKKDGKLEEITDQKQLVKEHLVENAGAFLDEDEDDDDYGDEDKEEPVEGNGGKIQKKEGMKHVGDSANKGGEFEVIGDNRNYFDDGRVVQKLTPGQIE